MVEVGDYLLYNGTSGSGYTFNKYYIISEINGFMAAFENDDGDRRVFLTTKPNGYGWTHIKTYEFRKQKIEKIKERCLKLEIR